MVPFRKWFTFQQTTSYNGLFNLVPNNLGDVIAAMRTSFAHWRLNSLRAKIFAATQPTSVYNAGYQAGADLALALGFCAIDYTKFASTPSWNSATQMPVYDMGPARGPTSIKVGRAVLRKTTVPWLETTSTGSESEAFQSAGVVYHGSYVSTATTGGYLVHVMVEGEVEFRDRIDNAVSLFAETSSSHSLHEECKGPAADADEREYLAIPRPRYLTAREEDLLSVASVRGPRPPLVRGDTSALTAEKLRQ